MNYPKPKVSIGMPVYNGEPFIRDALDAILAQSFKDFELIICDNASTDATAQICQAYAASDRRIRYYRNRENIGAAGNFNKVFQLSSGEYFKWAAHDDLHAPDYLAKCVSVLDSDRSIVLCHSQVQIVDSQGKFLKDYKIVLRTDSDNPVTRFHDLLSHHLCYPIFGLVRTKNLRNTPLMGNYGHTDGVLLANLSLQGRFYEISEPLFFSRHHQRQSMNMFFPEYLSLASGDTNVRTIPDYYAYSVWFDPTLQEQTIFPHWRIFWKYMLCVGLSSVSFKIKLGCYMSMFEQLKSLKFLLIKDLFFAVNQRFSLPDLTRETIEYQSTNPTKG